MKELFANIFKMYKQVIFAFGKSYDFSISDTSLYNSKLKEKEPEESKLRRWKLCMSDQNTLGFKNGIFGNCKQTKYLSIISALYLWCKKIKLNKHWPAPSPDLDQIFVGWMDEWNINAVEMCVDYCEIRKHIKESCKFRNIKD